jgi:hypothetical protein
LNYLSLMALTLAVALCIRRREAPDPATRRRTPEPHPSPSQTDRSQPETHALPPESHASPSEAHVLPSETRGFPSETRGFSPETRGIAPVLQNARARAFICVALAAYVWAAFELIATTRRFVPVNRARDEQARVASRLAGMARADAGAIPGADAPSVMDEFSHARPVVLATSFMLADNLPVGAPRASVLWSPHMHVYAGLTSDEHRERIYQFLYYTGVAPDNFRAYLDANPILVYTLFGAERVLPRLTIGHAPLTAAEFDREGRAYANYVAAFTRAEAARPALSYVITSPERAPDLSPLDRWYERDAGERVGGYTIQRVRLRP